MFYKTCEVRMWISLHLSLKQFQSECYIIILFSKIAHIRITNVKESSRHERVEIPYNSARCYRNSTIHHNYVFKPIFLLHVISVILKLAEYITKNIVFLFKNDV